MDSSYLLNAVSYAKGHLNKTRDYFRVLLLMKFFLIVSIALLLTYPSRVLAHTFTAGDLKYENGLESLHDWQVQLKENGFHLTLASIDQILTQRSEPGETPITCLKLAGSHQIDFSYAGSADNANITNAHTSLKALNLLCIPPGQEFSFNRSVGPRTVEKGYITGYSFSGGKHVPEIGGGVCRTSTLLYNAVLSAGLPVLERHSHSMRVAYAPRNRDATVYYGILDLVFRNDRATPLLIETFRIKNLLGLKLWELHGDTGEQPLPTPRHLQRVDLLPSDSIMLNNKPVNFLINPIVINGTTFVPLRELCAFLGAEVSWDGATNSVKAFYKGADLNMVINGGAQINGKGLRPDSPAIILGGMAWAPLRFTCESLGYKVSWDEGIRVILIDTPGHEPGLQANAHRNYSLG